MRLARDKRNERHEVKKMKEFILRARKAYTSGINLNELPKQGKLDSVCAAVASALWVSGDVRRDTIIHAVLEGPSNGPKTVTFTGNEIRGLRHDERSIASYLSEALQKGAWLKLNEETHVRTGIKVAKKSFERLIWEKSQEGKKTYMLDKSGTDIRKAAIGRSCIFVFGSAEGLPPKAEKLMKDMRAERISLGPKMLFASQCPVLVHNELDRRGL